MECLVCQGGVEVGCLSFCGAFVCGDCESRLMEQAVDDPRYDIQVHALRLLWQRKFVAIRDHHLMDGDYV